MPEQLLERPPIRRPEEETYGRSLSTIHRLGVFMLDAVGSNVVESPEAQQVRAEFYTSVEEGFGTDAEIGGLEVRDFDERTVMNGRVMSRDLKTAISTMTRDGLTCAQKTAEKDPRFLPQLTRSYWDHENAKRVDRMVRGETDYNTIIVVSPFVEEAAAESGDEYWRNIGYVPHRKRGFVQLYHFSGGKVTAGSLSFDGSDKQHLRHIFSEQGVDIPDGEITDNWLKYAVTRTLTVEEAKELALEIANEANGPDFQTKTNTVDVTHQHKEIMNKVFNDSYVHICESLARGRQTEGARQLIMQLTNHAHGFNQRYANALYKMRASDSFDDNDTAILHEVLVYSTIEMMRALHIDRSKPNKNFTGVAQDHLLADFIEQHLHEADTESFQGMLGGFGAAGAAQGRGYSACGLSISLGEERQSSNADAMTSGPQSRFGGMDKKLPDDKFGSRYFKCPKGHMNIRWIKNELIKNCQICKCDVSCA